MLATLGVVSVGALGAAIISTGSGTTQDGLGDSPQNFARDASPNNREAPRCGVDAHCERLGGPFYGSPKKSSISVSEGTLSESPRKMDVIALQATEFQGVLGSENRGAMSRIYDLAGTVPESYVDFASDYEFVKFIQNKLYTDGHMKIPQHPELEVAKHGNPIEATSVAVSEGEKLVGTNM